MRVGACLALLKQLRHLIQRQESQFNLIGLDLPDLGQRVCLMPGAQANQLREDCGQVALLVVDRLRLHFRKAALPITGSGQRIELEGERIT